MSELGKGLPDPNSYVRPLYPSEHKYFRANPHVAGMSTEDGRIILNPYSKNSPEEQQSVIHNEFWRLQMRNMEVPEFQLTPAQQKSLAKTPYATNPRAARETIIARFLSGDPSAGELTPEQLSFAQLMRLGNVGR